MAEDQSVMPAASPDGGPSTADRACTAAPSTWAPRGRPGYRHRHRHHHLHGAEQAQHVPHGSKRAGDHALHEHHRHRRPGAHAGHRGRRDRPLVRLHVRPRGDPRLGRLDRLGLADLAGHRPGLRGRHRGRRLQRAPGHAGQDPLVHRDPGHGTAHLRHDPARLRHCHAQPGVPTGGHGRSPRRRSTRSSRSPTRSCPGTSRCRGCG